MALEDQKIIIVRGEDVNLNFTPVTAPATTIAAWTLSFVVSVPGSTPTLTLTTTGGDISITSGTAGTLTVAISRARTSALTSNSPYLWELWRTDTGSYEKLAGGQLLARRPVLPAA